MFDDCHDLSGKTALVSLNAMIEAARAGDAGKPFADAAEVLFRLTRQSTATATDETIAVIRGGERSLLSSTDLDRYQLAIHRELSKISAIAEALDSRASAAVDSLQAANASVDVDVCDKRLAQDLLALADLIKCKKSGIDAALASDTIELDAKINALQWALEKRTTGPDSAACANEVDRNNYEMF